MNFRQWEINFNNSHHMTYSTSFQFKVLSYNVLSQKLLQYHRYLYNDCHPETLQWSFRGTLLFNEVLRLNPDILCFQEVEKSHLYSFYSQFEQLGYDGIFKSKTGQKPDGCAIYFKRTMFKLKEQASVEFLQPTMPVLDKDNIGLMLKLEPIALPGSPFVIATTHLLYNPRRTNIRLAQMQLFLAEIDRFSYINSKHGCKHLPIILTGDFNSTPDNPVVTLLDAGTVNVGSLRQGSDWKSIEVTDHCQHLAVYLNRQKGGYVTEQAHIKIHSSEYSDQSNKPVVDLENYNDLFNGNVISHSLDLVSVYDRTKPNGQSEATTFQDYWVTVDYIYFSRHSSLNVLERLRLPTSEECQMLGNLPNALYGSDHLALMALFELNPFKSTL